MSSWPMPSVIQWIAGAGRGESQDWTWLSRRIDALGKGQLLSGDAARLKRAWRELGNRKLFYILSAESRAEVEDCLAELDGTPCNKPDPA